jgi:hypothetical protein
MLFLTTQRRGRNAKERQFMLNVKSKIYSLFNKLLLIENSLTAFTCNTIGILKDVFGRETNPSLLNAASIFDSVYQTFKVIKNALTIYDFYAQREEYQTFISQLCAKTTKEELNTFIASLNKQVLTLAKGQQRKLIKRQLALASFCLNGNDVSNFFNQLKAQYTTNPSGTIDWIQTNLNKEVVDATKQINIEKYKNRLVDELHDQNVNWWLSVLNLTIAVLALVLSFVVASAILAAVRFVTNTATIVIKYNDVVIQGQGVAGRKLYTNLADWDKKAWYQKLGFFIGCIFTEAYYGDIAFSLALLFTVISLSGIALSPLMVTVLAWAGLACSVACFTGLLHETIKNSKKIDWLDLIGLTLVAGVSFSLVSFGSALLIPALTAIGAIGAILLIPTLIAMVAITVLAFAGSKLIDLPIVRPNHGKPTTIPSSNNTVELGLVVTNVIDSSEPLTQLAQQS